MRILLAIFVISCTTFHTAQACCWPWCCCAPARKPVAPKYIPSEEEERAIKARLDNLKDASITDVDKAACTALGIKYEDLLNHQVERSAAGTGTIVARTRRSSLTRRAGEDATLGLFQDLISKETDLTPGEIGNCIRHLGITEEELAMLRGKAAKES